MRIAHGTSQNAQSPAAPSIQFGFNSPASSPWPLTHTLPSLWLTFNHGCPSHPHCEEGSVLYKIHVVIYVIYKYYMYIIKQDLMSPQLT